jgi:uncharacterized membrane protein YeaQ/YmgE (transglycosylase-associated protein family)
MNIVPLEFRHRFNLETPMDAHGIIIWLIIGAIAGWLAGALVKGGGYGLIGDILVGIAGAFIGGWLAARLGIMIGSGLLSAIITATLGAVILLFIVRLIKRA